MQMQLKMKELEQYRCYIENNIGVTLRTI